MIVSSMMRLYFLCNLQLFSKSGHGEFQVLTFISTKGLYVMVI